MSRPALPNPGKHRYWSITMDHMGDFTLTLHEESGKVVAESDCIEKEFVTKYSFENRAAELLTVVKNKDTFAGAYKFDGDN